MRLSASGLAVLCLGGCALFCPRPPLSPAYDTPEDTVRTFLGAFLENRQDIEFRCLSKALRSRERIRMTEYALFRQRLEEEHHLGLLRFVSPDAAISIERDERSPHLARARIDVAGREVRFRMVLEHLVHLDLEDGEIYEEILDSLPAQVRVHATNAGGVVAILLRETEDVAVERIARLRVEPRWKIDEIPVLEGEEPEP